MPLTTGAFRFFTCAHVFDNILIQYNNLNSSGVDPDPYQIERKDPYPDPHQFADDKPKCMEYEPI